MKKIKAFFKGVKKESEKTKWPSGKDLLTYTGVVVFLMLFFCLYFYGLDVVFALLKGLVS